MNEFIDALPPEWQEEIDFTISLLNRLGSHDPPLPFPHSSQVEGQLRELRCHYGRDLYRILYRRSRNLFVLLHRREADEDDLAGRHRHRQRSLSGLPRRRAAPRRRPPLAAGGDAP